MTGRDSRDQVLWSWPCWCRWSRQPTKAGTFCHTQGKYTLWLFIVRVSWQQSVLQVTETYGRRTVSCSVPEKHIDKNRNMISIVMASSTVLEWQQTVNNYCFTLVLLTFFLKLRNLQMTLEKEVLECRCSDFPSLYLSLFPSLTI